MRENYNRQLKKLNQDLTELGALCKQAVSEAVTALLDFDRQARQQTFMTEYEIDNKEREIEGQCMKLLLTQQPVAGDLRAISAALRMISDMERIGDQASDIADIAKHLEGSRSARHVHIRRMAEAAMKMLTDSIDAFVRTDLQAAREVMKADDLVDELFNQIRTELIRLVHEDPQEGEQCLNILMIAKYFERIGDHVVNIAEWVEYSVTGEHREHT